MESTKSLDRLPTISEDQENQSSITNKTADAYITPVVPDSSVDAGPSEKLETRNEKTSTPAFERPSFDHRFEVDLEKGNMDEKKPTARKNTMELIRYQTDPSAVSEKSCDKSFANSDEPIISEKTEKHRETTPHNNIFVNVKYVFGALKKGCGSEPIIPPPNSHGGSRAYLPKNLSITDLIKRQELITRIGQCLLWYGAPAYYVEEILEAVAQALYVPASFNYRIGRINCEFAELDGRSSMGVQILEAESWNIKKLELVFRVFADIVNNKISVDDAAEEIEKVIKKNDLSRWIRIPVFAFAAASLGPFAFGGRWVDAVITSVLGLVVGILQMVIYPKREDIATLSIAINAVVSSFVAAGINARHQDRVCLPALAQASVALTLPGYPMLIGTIELLSTRNIQAGSARILFSIIWTYIFAFGIGNAFTLYRLFDSKASFSNFDGCEMEKPVWSTFSMAVAFIVCVQVINKASMKQTAVGFVLGMAGFAIQFGMNKWAGWPQLSSFVGAFLVAATGSVHTRWFKGLGWATMLPGILLQVPGGLLAEGGMASGLRMVDTVFNQGKNEFANMGFKESVLENGFTVVEICVAVTLGIMAGGSVIYLGTGGKKHKRERLWSF